MVLLGVTTERIAACRAAMPLLKLIAPSAPSSAERMAVVGGYLDPHRADGRVFFEDDAPPDPFTTERTRAMEREMQHDEIQQNAEYSIDALAANGDARLDILKSWGDAAHEHDAEPW